ncbi:50S ribosome-binding GTPase [soil metagenome]
MSALDTVPRAVGGAPSGIAVRIDGLAAAVEAGRGRIDAELIDPAQLVVDRATERMLLSSEHTIAALAGATGSGKSSLFNSLTDLDIAGVGVRRPTTSWALACAWGPGGAEEILSWMGIPPRHQVSRMSMLDQSSDDTKLEGLILLDLPDHDSTEMAHHLEMERLVQYADLLIWVLDPQKYADAAVHERYIRPMASHAEVTVVVLNQLDRIPYEQRETALNDVRRIITEGGLDNVTVLGVSATRGDGVDDLKRVLSQRIKDKKSASSRLGADVADAARLLAEASGTAKVPGIAPADREALDKALVDSAGVPIVVQAIRRSTQRRARMKTSWPVLRWLMLLRKDPLKDLGLERDLSVASLARSTIPEATPIHKASAEVAVRDLAEKASVGVGKPWATAIRSASASQAADITVALDEAIEGTDLDVAKPALWWYFVYFLQWIFFLALIGGLGWMAALGISDLFSLDMPSAPEAGGLGLPALLAIGGAVLGLAFSLFSRFAARSSGSRKAKRADVALRAAISEVAQREVIVPIQAELDRYDACRKGLAAALR